MTAGRLIVVGGSVAGIGVVDELRKLGDCRPVTVLEAQDHLPYDRPPLSKGVLSGDVAAKELAFHDADHYRRLGVEVRLSTEVRVLRAADRAVELHNGDVLCGEAIVIATGAAPRRLPGTDDGTVHVLRVLDDAERLRSALADATRVVVIGGGFIGSEVASTALGGGREVILVEAESSPLVHRLGAEVSELLVDLHRRAGVRVLCGRPVARVESGPTGPTVVLADGEAIAADVVVAGLGVRPEADWLSGSGVALAQGGVLCDDRGRTSVPGVYAIGDVATWPDGTTGRPARHEHWTSAREQARIVAAMLAGAEAPSWAATVPYVWSDQHGSRIQILGRPSASDEVHLVSGVAMGGFLALYERAGALTGVVGCDAAARVGRLRSLVAGHGALSDALAAARSSPRRRPTPTGVVKPQRTNH